MMIRTILVVVPAIICSFTVQADTGDYQVCRDTVEMLATKFGKSCVLKSCCSVNNNGQIHQQRHDKQKAKESNNSTCAPPADGQWKCEHSECMLERSGVITEKGTVDYKKIEDMFESLGKHYPGAKSMVAQASKMCTEENIKAMPDDGCVAANVQACIMSVIIPECHDSWNQTDARCVDIGEKAEGCKVAIIEHMSG